MLEKQFNLPYEPAPDKEEDAVKAGASTFEQGERKGRKPPPQPRVTLRDVGQAMPQWVREELRKLKDRSSKGQQPRP